MTCIIIYLILWSGYKFVCRNLGEKQSSRSFGSEGVDISLFLALFIFPLAFVKISCQVLYWSKNTVPVSELGSNWCIQTILSITCAVLFDLNYYSLWSAFWIWTELCCWYVRAKCPCFVLIWWNFKTWLCYKIQYSIVVQHLQKTFGSALEVDKSKCMCLISVLKCCCI